ncbi:ClpX C4-type zinc finger protein [Pseudonocardia saturnea]
MPPAPPTSTPSARCTSLREIADELGLSHQRVHQLLSLPTRPGARGPGRQSAELTCSFCERPQTAVTKLIAGPGVAVCSDCVAPVTQVVRHGTSAADGRATVSPAGPAQSCSFCGKGPHEVPASAQAGSGVAVICAECLELCNEILVEVQPDPA